VGGEGVIQKAFVILSARCLRAKDLCTSRQLHRSFAAKDAAQDDKLSFRQRQDDDAVNFVFTLGAEFNDDSIRGLGDVDWLAAEQQLRG
jgi:hypothetical protein